jgi:hypothetical protein
MVNGTRARYDAILVVGIVAGVAKCINGTLWVGRSCKEIIGDVSVVLVERLIAPSRTCCMKFEQLLIKHVGVHDHRSR